METVITISKQRTFTLAEAHELLPVIYRITETAYTQMKVLTNRHHAVAGTNPTTAAAIDQEIQLLVEKWQKKVERLGASPKGIWLADFDNGTGYYCWKFPETKIGFSHGYREGFTGRKPILSPMETLEAKPQKIDEQGESLNENSSSANQHRLRELSEEFRKDH